MLSRPAGGRRKFQIVGGTIKKRVSSKKTRKNKLSKRRKTKKDVKINYQKTKNKKVNKIQKKI